RALARELGRDLGCLAHVTVVRGRRVGRFDVSRAVAAAALADPGAGAAAASDPLDALAHLPRLRLTATGADDIASGRQIDRPAGAPRAGIVALEEGGRLRAIAEVEAGRIRPRKVFHD